MKNTKLPKRLGKFNMSINETATITGNKVAKRFASELDDYKKSYENTVADFNRGQELMDYVKKEYDLDPQLEINEMEIVVVILIPDSLPEEETITMVKDNKLQDMLLVDEWGVEDMIEDGKLYNVIRR